MLPTVVYALTGYFTIIFALIGVSAMGFLKLWSGATVFAIGGLYKRYQARRKLAAPAEARLLRSSSTQG